MLSTLLNYRTYTTNMTKTLDRIQQSTSVAGDTKYYKETIGTIKTVDAFLDDRRLYTYALKAYGLEDQASSQGFIRKVIESDLTDTASFANRLNDQRFRQFAQAFNFDAATVETPTEPQSARQKQALTEAYSEYRVRQGSTLAAKTTYFQSEIKSITTVDAFLGNTVLFDVAMSSIGMDPALTSKTYIRDIFLGKVSDDTSSVSDDKFFALADTFNFLADGTLAQGTLALDAGAVGDLVHRYNVRKDNLSSPQSATHESQYYAERIAVTDDAFDLVMDPRLFDYIRKAYVLPDDVTPALLYNVITAAPADVDDVITAAELPQNGKYPDYEVRLAELRTAFDFAKDGSAKPGEGQTATAREALIDRFYENYTFDTDAKAAVATSRFEDALYDRIKSVSTLLARYQDFDRDAIEYVLLAFDIDPATASLTKVRRVLQSDVSDPNSYVNKLGDPRYEKLAAAFNFDENGKIRAERVVQSASNQTQTGTRYRESFGKDLSTVKKELITTETRAYLEAVAEITTLDAFVESPKVTQYALTAYGLADEDLSQDDLRKLLTSDLADRESYANSFADDRYTDFVAAFNFQPNGTVKLADAGVQSGYDLLTTESLFLLTTLEQQAGETSEGARLALYFLRKAPETKTTSGILADRALLEVVRTTLGLPASLSQLDLDKQISIIEKRLDIADFKDPKKLDKFIARFAGLYDIANADPATTSPVLGLFGNSGSSSGGLLALL